MSGAGYKDISNSLNTFSFSFIKLVLQYIIKKWKEYDTAANIPKAVSKAAESYASCHQARKVCEGRRQNEWSTMLGNPEVKPGLQVMWNICKDLLYSRAMTLSMQSKFLTNVWKTTLMLWSGWTNLLRIWNEYFYRHCTSSWNRCQAVSHTKRNFHMRGDIKKINKKP